MRCYGEKPAWFQRETGGLLPVVRLDGELITDSVSIMLALERAFADDTESLLDDPFQLATSSAADLYDGEIDDASAALLDDPFGSTPMRHEPVSSVQPLPDVGPISDSQQASSAVAQPSDAATDAKLESLLGELQW